jgi:hypothetical protein
VPIEVASKLAEHALIYTTSIYSTQELARKIQAVQGMKRRDEGGLSARQPEGTVRNMFSIFVKRT